MSFNKKFLNKSPINNHGGPHNGQPSVTANTKAFSGKKDPKFTGFVPSSGGESDYGLHVQPPGRSNAFNSWNNEPEFKTEAEKKKEKITRAELIKRNQETRRSKAGTKILDNIQDKIETAGMIPLAGTIPDAVNVGISATRGLLSKVEGDKEGQIKHATNMAAFSLNAIPALGLVSASLNKTKKLANKLDKALFPNTAFRAVPASGASRTTYSKGKEQLMERIQKKGDFYTKDIDEAKFYATGNFSGTKGLKQGDDIIFTETKIPFWKNPVTKDKNVVKLKSFDKDVANPNEYLIPNKGFSSIFYPKKSTKLKAVPDHILDPRYKDAISLGDPANPSSGISQYLKTSEAKYIDDQIKGAESFSTKFNKRKGNFYYEK